MGRGAQGRQRERCWQRTNPWELSHRLVGAAREAGSFLQGSELDGERHCGS